MPTQGLLTYTPTHIIWDFNGTLLDDVQLGIDSVNRMLIPRGLPPVKDVASYREIFRFPIYDYYRALGFDYEKEDFYTVLAPEWIINYMEGEADCPLNHGVTRTLTRIAQAGIPQVLLSATERSQLLLQLKHVGLSGCFEEVMGLDNIHARSKTALALAWKQAHPEARPLFVGDTLHDAEVAEAAGADVVLFTGGHMSERRLSAADKPMIRAIPELLDLLGL